MSITQKQRAKIIVNSYKNWDLKGKKVLDVGCGNGVVSQVLKDDLDLDLYGTDIIDYCTIDIPFKKMNEKTNLPFKDLFFDYIMFNDVLHHSDDNTITSLLIEGKRVANAIIIVEDKKLFFSNVFETTVNYFYSSRMACPSNFKTKQEWLSLFEKLGLNCEESEVIYPLWYPLRHMVFKLTKYDKD